MQYLLKTHKWFNSLEVCDRRLFHNYRGNACGLGQIHTVQDFDHVGLHPFLSLWQKTSIQKNQRCDWVWVKYFYRKQNVRINLSCLWSVLSPHHFWLAWQKHCIIFHN
jgi:hypothetical protein